MIETQSVTSLKPNILSATMNTSEIWSVHHLLKTRITTGRIAKATTRKNQCQKTPCFAQDSWKANFATAVAIATKNQSGVDVKKPLRAAKEALVMKSKLISER